MSPNADGAVWQRPARPPRGRLAKLLLAAAAALLVSQYLAGFLFLWSVHGDPKSASPLTITRYGYYYGARSSIRHRLWYSSAVGIGLVLATFGSATPAAPARTAWRCPLCHAPGDRRGGTLGARGHHPGCPWEAMSHAGGPAGRGARGSPASGQGHRRRRAQRVELAGVAGLRRHQARELDADCGLSASLGPGLLPL